VREERVQIEGGQSAGLNLVWERDRYRYRYDGASSGLLEHRDEHAITVVFQTASLGYVAGERRAELYGEIESAGRRGALAFLTSAFDPDVEDCWPLELTVWPGCETRRLAFLDFHGAWLEWLL
jgi:hypothetical protein